MPILCDLDSALKPAYLHLKAASWASQNNSVASCYLSIYDKGIEPCCSGKESPEKYFEVGFNCK